MAFIVRLFTLLTIAAAGFAMPMTCAQSGSASAASPVSIEITSSQQLGSADASSAGSPDVQERAQSLATRLFEHTPLDCGGKSTPRATDHPAFFDTQPFVPGYLSGTIQLEQQRSTVSAHPAALLPVESRAGPPDGPPPRLID